MNSVIDPKKLGRKNHPKKPYLQVTLSPHLKVGECFYLTPGDNGVGRHKEGNRVVIPERFVSRKHCILEVTHKGDVFLKDVKGSNGVFINAAKIRETTRVKEKDSIQIGDTFLSLFYEKPKEILPPTPEALLDKTSVSMGKPVDTFSKTKSFSLNKKTIRNVGIVFGVLLLGMLLFRGCFSRSKRDSLPGPKDCTQLYSLIDVGCQFYHPSGWKRLDKFRKSVFAYTYFDKTTLFFGTSYKGKNVLFAVDVLNGVPPSVSLEKIVDTEGKRFPRSLNHGKELLGLTEVSLSGKRALVGESPPFQRNQSSLRTLEYYFLHEGKRFLLMGFTEASLFPHFLPLFKHMAHSFTLISPKEGLIKPDDVSSEVRLIVKTADALVTNRNVKPENLFLALRNYQKAALLTNLFDFREEDPFRLDFFHRFQNTQSLLNTEYKDLKFKIDRGLKIGENEQVFDSALRILTLIPDQDDPRVKKALFYYKKFKKQYEAQ